MGTAVLIFLAIGGVALVVLIISLLIGEALHFLPVDADGPFSLPAIAAFVGGFGFVGAIPVALLEPVNPSLAVPVGAAAGLVAAFPLAFLTIRLTRSLMRMRTDATPTSADMLGGQGVVTSDIPADGYGQVRVTVGGQPVQLNAKADRPLSAGTAVYVVEVPSPTSVVVVETTALT